MISVSIVDDEKELRQSLTTFVNGAPGFSCVSAYSSAEAALAGLPGDKPDVVLMDINLGGMVFVILAAFIWIKQLRRQVEERTNQLTTEIQLREQTERQRSLEKERARIAQDLHDEMGAKLCRI